MYRWRWVAGALMAGFLSVSIGCGCKNPQTDGIKVPLSPHSASYPETEPVWYSPAEPLPEFDAAATTGDTLRSRDLAGSALVLHFWTTWCPPCTRQIPILNDLARTYRDSNIVVISISLDDIDLDSLRVLCRQQGITYPVLAGSDAFAERFGGVYSLPTTFFVDHSGRMRSQKIGRFTLDQVRPLLAPLVRKMK